MVQKICLDTDVCVELIKNTEKGMYFFEKFMEDDICVSAITAYELNQREKNLEPVKRFLVKVEILNFNLKSAQEAADIYKNLKSMGKIVDFRDIFIAGICMTHKCSLLTMNKKHFKHIQGLKII
tara:strand:- start:4476 stop:4847 length:372 start_codon:yes stop_codon:yes gene_type:complete